LIDDLLKKYPNDLRVVVKQFPLSFHKQAKKASMYALAAERQGKYMEMSNKIFENYRDLRTNEDLPRQYAQELGLDMAKFDEDMKDPALEARITKEMNQMKQSGIPRMSVPKFLINGKEPQGSRNVENYSSIIALEIKHSKTRSFEQNKYLDIYSADKNKISVTFSYPSSTKGNHKIFLAGNFNNWSPNTTPMKENNGNYSVTLYLEPGEYSYKFVVDGNWVVDENAEEFNDDGFGGKNSVIHVYKKHQAIAEFSDSQKVLMKRLDTMEKTIANLAITSKSKPADTQPAQVDPNKVYNIPIGDSFSKGPEDAVVTIIEWLDFQ